MISWYTLRATGCLHAVHPDLRDAQGTGPKSGQPRRTAGIGCAAGAVPCAGPERGAALAYGLGPAVDELDLPCGQPPGLPRQVGYGVRRRVDRCQLRSVTARCRQQVGEGQVDAAVPACVAGPHTGCFRARGDEGAVAPGEWGAGMLDILPCGQGHLRSVVRREAGASECLIPLEPLETANRTRPAYMHNSWPEQLTDFPLRRTSQYGTAKPIEA